MGEVASVLIAEFRERGYHDIDDTRGLRFLNTGVRRLCRVEAWPFLRTTVDSVPPAVTRTLTRPRMVHKVALIDGVNEVALQYLTPGSVRYHYPNGAAATTGRPAHFTLEEVIGGPSEVRVLGNGALVFRTLYTQRPVLLTNVASECIVPDDWSDLVVDAMVLEAAKDRHDWETVAGLRGELVEGIAAMRETLIDGQDSDHQRVIAVMGDIYE